MEINLANHAACIARIERRGQIGKEEARALLEAVGERAEEMRRTGSIDPVVDAAWELSQKLKVDADARKVDALRNAGTRQRHFAEIIRQGIGKGVDYLLGTLYWQPGTGFKDTVETAGRALAHGWASSLYAMVEKFGLLKTMGDSKMFAEISRELWDLRTGAATINLPKATPARKIAEAIFQHQEAMRDRLNGAGARIAKALDWIATTSHDDYLIRRGGRGVAPLTDVDESFRSWRDTVKPLLDDATYKNMTIAPPLTEAAMRENFLRSVYNALVDGVHLTEHREAGGVGPAFEGTRNIARSISQGRVLLWKDADSWSTYMGRYGKSTNWASLMEHSIERAGRQSALMERWGTNPAGNLNLLIQRVREHYQRLNDVDGIKRFDQHLNSRWGIKLDNVMAHLDGRSNIATNEMAAVIGRTVRQFYDITLLGAVQLTHAASLISTLPSEMRWHGIGSLESMAGLIGGIFHGIKNEDMLDVRAELGSLGDGMAREAFDPFARGAGGNAPGWGVPGQIANMHNRFMKMTGLPYLFNSAKRGVREMVANKLARLSPGAFDAIPAKLQQTLRSYGIAEPEWEMLKSGTLTKTRSGHDYLTPATPKSIPNAVIENSLRQRGMIAMASSRDVIDAAIAGQRRAMADHLAMLYEDAASHSVVEAGVREQSFLRGNVAKGSWQSELLNGITQFRTWPIAALHQVLAREYYQSATLSQFAVGALMVGGLSMLGGYLRMTARDLMYNQQPRVPRTVGELKNIMMASLAQGGGLGIFGDYLFGEVGRNGVGFASTLGGPATSDVARLYGIYNEWTGKLGTGQRSDALPELTRWGVSHVPFANLVYLKSILDYGLWFHLYEAERPGWWNRMNTRMKKEQGRTTFGYRPGTPIPYVPPIIGRAIGTQH